MSLRSYLTGQSQPVVFPLPGQWPCSDYTIDDWSRVLPDFFDFRHESYESAPQFENQQNERFRATIGQFSDAVRKGLSAILLSARSVTEVMLILL